MVKFIDNFHCQLERKKYDMLYWRIFFFKRFWSSDIDLFISSGRPLETFNRLLVI